MIKSKELKYFLLRDKKALKKSRNSPKFFSDEIWKYRIYLGNVNIILTTSTK